MKYKLLSSALAFGLVLMLTNFSGSLAYFSDVETSAGNTLQAGEWSINAKIRILPPPYFPPEVFIKSWGKCLPVLAYIDLPEGYDERDIGVSTVKLRHGDKFVQTERFCFKSYSKKIPSDVLERLDELREEAEILEKGFDIPCRLCLRKAIKAIGKKSIPSGKSSSIEASCICEGRWVKFPGDEVAEMLCEFGKGDNIELEVTGKLADGTSFEGRDGIIVFENREEFHDYHSRCLLGIEMSEICNNGDG